MTAILLGSAEGQPPKPGKSQTIELPKQVPSDPIVLQDTVKVNDCTPTS